MSDVYVYEHYMGQWVIHVGSLKHIPPCPPEIEDPYSYAVIRRMKDDGGFQGEGWRKVYQIYRAWLDSTELVPINLPYDGQSFYENDPGATAERLQILKDIGYHVPDGVIEELRKEMLTFDADKHLAEIEASIKADRL